MSPTRIFCACANASGFGNNAPAVSIPADVKNLLRFMMRSNFIFSSVPSIQWSTGVRDPETQYFNTPSLQYSIFPSFGAQLESLYLAGRGLRQFRDEFNPARIFVGGEPAFHVLLQISGELRGLWYVRKKNDVSLRFDQAVFVGL